MRLSAHELHDLHELTMSCVNSITNMACFINQAQDPQLKSLLQRHFPHHIQDYNIKVDLLQKAGVSTLHFSAPQMQQVNINQPTNLQPVTPRTDVQQFNDREITTAYLLTLKRAGREYAWSAMECSNPEIRSFLENAFQMSSHHAFEVWQYMVQKGYYPVEAADQSSLNLYGRVYQPVPNAQQISMM
ncbi:MAG: spore coat protein [Desulfotomaculaceae bacterium]|nr:spore coat protein [Desulfotomaculaceae bacterium]